MYLQSINKLVTIHLYLLRKTTILTTTVLALVIISSTLFSGDSHISVTAAIGVASTAAAAAAVTATSSYSSTVTPIKHLVVIFQENVAFDHYFATYPKAANPAGQPDFSASPDTPSINGLAAGLLTNNTNLANPFRLDRSQAVIATSCNPAHKYT